MMMPPLTWLSQVSLLTINPQSCTHRTFFTFTKPVSVSTSASANCTPPATHLNAGVGVDLRLGLRAVSAAAPRGAGATDASLDGARGTSRWLELLFPAEFLSAELVFALPDFARVVLQANLDRVHLQLHGE